MEMLHLFDDLRRLELNEQQEIEILKECKITLCRNIMVGIVIYGRPLIVSLSYFSCFFYLFIYV